MRPIVYTLCFMQAIFSTNVFAIAPQSIVAQLPPPALSHSLSTEMKMHPKIKGDSVRGHFLLREKEADPTAAYLHPYEPVTDIGADGLPVPEQIKMPAKKLSLYEAIAIALRNNPAVRMAELQRITDKFSLETTIHDRYDLIWDPLTLSSTLANHQAPLWSATTGFGVRTSAGTAFSLAHSNNLLGGLGSTALTMSQPFLQNFGFEYNRIIYQNAIDGEKIARLNFKNSVMTTVNTVIASYRTLVQDYGTLAQDKISLATQEAEVRNNLLELKAGQIAPSDVVQQQANIETTRLTLVQERQTIQTDYLAFLITLGLVPSTKVIVDHHISVRNENVPSKKTCIQLALKHNIAYRSALLNLNITKRTLITANNQRKWSLNAVTSVTEGSQRSAVGSPIYTIGTNPSVALKLSIPIDNIDLKAAVVNAKIQIEDAKMQLAQTKETLISTVLSQWYGIYNLHEQIQIAKKALDLQEKTLQDAKLKLKYGKTSMFEVNTLETNLLQQQVNLISTKISYLNAIETLNQTLGITLERWHIKLVY